MKYLLRMQNERLHMHKAVGCVQHYLDSKGSNGIVTEKIDADGTAPIFRRRPAINAYAATSLNAIPNASAMPLP